MVQARPQPNKNATPILRKAGALLSARKPLELSGLRPWHDSAPNDLSMHSSIEYAKTLPGCVIASLSAYNSFRHDGQGEAMRFT